MTKLTSAQANFLASLIASAREGPTEPVLLHEDWGKSNSKKFPVPDTMSTSWCWPFPSGTWYTMRFEDSKLLDHLHKMEGNRDTPTHEQKLELIKKHGWLTKRIGNFIHVASP